MPSVVWVRIKPFSFNSLCRVICLGLLLDMTVQWQARAESVKRDLETFTQRYREASSHTATMGVCSDSLAAIHRLMMVLADSRDGVIGLEALLVDIENKVDLVSSKASQVLSRLLRGADPSCAEDLLWDVADRVVKSLRSKGAGGEVISSTHIELAALLCGCYAASDGKHSHSSTVMLLLECPQFLKAFDEAVRHSFQRLEVFGGRNYGLESGDDEDYIGFKYSIILVSCVGGF